MCASDRSTLVVLVPAYHDAGGCRWSRLDRLGSLVGCLRSLIAAVDRWRRAGTGLAFDEVTVVLRGMVRVESESGILDVRAGQAVVTSAGEWVRYSTPEGEGAEYIAVCVPAFSPENVNRDAD